MLIDLHIDTERLDKQALKTTAAMLLALAGMTNVTVTGNVAQQADDGEDDPSPQAAFNGFAAPSPGGAPQPPMTGMNPALGAPYAPPPVQAPTPPVTVAIGATAETDVTGIPWDERIHASSRSKIADGTWRMKKGVDKGVVETVKAELKARAGGQPAAPANVPQPPAAAPAPAPTVQPDPVAAYQAMGGVMPGNPIPPQPAPAPVPAPATTPFIQFMQALNAQAAADPSISQRANDACKQLGLANVVALNAPGAQGHILTVAGIIQLPLPQTLIDALSAG